MTVSICRVGDLDANPSGLPQVYESPELVKLVFKLVFLLASRPGLNSITSCLEAPHLHYEQARKDTTHEMRENWIELKKNRENYN